MILLSVGHSELVRGAYNKEFNLAEYDLCKQIVHSAWEWLHGRKINVVISDVKQKFPYSQYKINTVNALKPDVSIEFHLNSHTNTQADYSSCFFWHENAKMGRLSAHILANCKTAFTKMGWGKTKSIPLPCDGFDTERFWWITETKSPTILLEPLFLSNPKQAAWLATDGACSAVGFIIAEAINSWIIGEKLIETS